MTPTVGRIVHYILLGNADCIAAIITQVNNEETGNINLMTFPPNGDPPVAHLNVPQSQGPSLAVNTWHWPEFVL